MTSKKILKAASYSRRVKYICLQPSFSLSFLGDYKIFSMSDFSAEFITKMLSDYDVLIRRTIVEGKLDSFLEKEKEIVSYM